MVGLSKARFQSVWKVNIQAVECGLLNICLKRKTLTYRIHVIAKSHGTGRNTGKGED